MQGIDLVITAFFFFGLWLFILGYSNKNLTQRPNQIFLLLAVIMLLIWGTLVIMGLGGPF